jgi:hypothetical protein
MFNFLNEENTCPCFLIQMYENVCLDSLLVRQLKHMGFICNALNCLYILFLFKFTYFYLIQVTNFLL